MGVTASVRTLLIRFSVELFRHSIGEKRFTSWSHSSSQPPSPPFRNNRFLFAHSFIRGFREPPPIEYGVTEPIP